MITRIAMPALALAFVLVANPAAAANTSVTVAYGDLDLTKDDDRKLLDQRLARATRRVCGSPAVVRAVAEMMARRACIAEARGSYKSQVELALDNANARRVAVLADKIGLLASF